MEIKFNIKPDETGKGRVIIDGRFYALPLEATRLFCVLYGMSTITSPKMIDELLENFQHLMVSK